MANSWIIHYEIAAIVIIISIIGLFIVGERIRTKESKIFLQILIVALVASVFDQLSVLGLSKIIHVSIAGNYFLNIVYNAAMLCLVYLYAVYITNLTQTYIIYVKKRMILLVLPMLIETLLVIATPINHFVFYIDENGEYFRGPGMPLYLMVFAIYIVYISYLCIKRNRYLNKKQIFSILFYTTVDIICIILQIVFPQLLLNSFATAIGIIMIYFSMQGDFVDTDKMLGTFSAEAFRKKIQIAKQSGKHFNIITIRIGGFDEMSVIHGFEATNDILRQVAEFLIKLIPEHMVFHVNGNYFACYVEGDDSDAFEYAVRIQERFLQRFRTENMKNDAMVLFKIAVVSMPAIVDDYDKMIAISNILLEKMQADDSKYITVADDSVIEKYNYRCSVERAIDKAVRNGEFDVHFQPIINLENNKVEGAEALIRLYDENIGQIEPEVFLPVAEKNGSIVQITSMVVHRVCRFILDNEVEKHGIEYIGINLSSEECQHRGMADRLLAIVKGYELPPNMIRFEVREGTRRDGLSNVKENMDKLVNGGMQLVLDGFGLGYSNATELVNLPIAMIKIDRNLLWLAKEDNDAMSVLKALVEMMHCLERTVLVSGVEEEVYEEIINELDIKYAQGYYYSKAVDSKAFIEYVKNVNEYGMSPSAE